MLIVVIGSGFDACGPLGCLKSVRERVFSPTPASRERFAESFRPGLNVEAVNSAQEAA
jgi:ornithine cyclodeaminase/alanine dehydrogenase-like protein (mu-crystallin family)